jgi:chaperonin GroES
MKATGNQVIIRPDPPVERTEAGILIPVEARVPQNTGTVVDGAKYEDIKDENVVKMTEVFNKGDRVSFPYGRGYEVEYEGEVFLSIHKDWILSKLWYSQFFLNCG